MEETKTVTSVSITPVVKEAAVNLANYNGFRSFSELVESLLIDWLNKTSPKWFQESKEYKEVQKMGEKEEPR